MCQYPQISCSVARQNEGIKQPHNRKQCTSRQQMDEGARKLRRIGSIRYRFLNVDKNETIFPSIFTLAGSEFHTVGAATEKARS